MPDDPTKRGQADRIRINVHEQHELQNWSPKFGVNPDELKAVAKIGPMADEVERELKVLV